MTAHWTVKCDRSSLQLLGAIVPEELQILINFNLIWATLYD